MTADGPDVVRRMADRMNARDLDGMVALMHPDYVSEQPLHPARNFVGRAQMKANWGTILAGIPDLRADIVRQTQDGETTWSEWHWYGTTESGAAFDLRGGWGLGVQAEIDFLLSDDGSDYGVAFLHTAALGRDLAEDLGGYVEYIGIAFSGLDADYEAYLGGGLTYAINDNLQLDLGANFGLTDAAADFNFFTGLSFRH